MTYNVAYEAVKFWLPIVTVLTIVVRGFRSIFKLIKDWIESYFGAIRTDIQVIKSNHLHGIEEGIKELNGKVDGQTKAIVDELRATRSDLIAVVASKH